MKHTIFFLWLCCSLLCVTAAAQDMHADTLQAEPISPLPEEARVDPAKAALGRRLFHDARLSGNGKVSCATCHDLSRGGMIPGQPHSSPGVSGKSIPLNIPTVFNSVFNFTQFWDGRAASLEEQLDGPLHHPDEMGAGWSHVVSVLKSDAEYARAFYKIYRAPPGEKNIRDAMAVFESSLQTPGAPFDRFLRGDKMALTVQQKKGYDLFKTYGCVSCHQGRNIGGNMFQVFGVVGNYFIDRGGITEQDYGRYNITHDEADRFVFRVPSLRNVARTPPYFHDGSAKTLEEAIDIMARYQLGRVLEAEERAALAAFLESLNGRLPATTGDE